MNNIKNQIKAIIPDKMYIQWLYYKHFHKFINFSNPKTFDEKLNWLKLYDRRPEYTKMVDKYVVKKYITDIVGDGYVVPVVGGPWDSFEEINFDSLPDQFVLKTTHDCGGVVVCRDKSEFDKENARTFLTDHLKKNYYMICREWPYVNVKPRLFAEEYIEDKNDGELRDYKLYSFNGHVEATLVATNRLNGDSPLTFDYFDEDFNHLNWVNEWHPNASSIPHKPKKYEEMKLLAEKLSKGFPHLRVDFYEANGNIYIGELTLYDMGGFLIIHPDEWELRFGNLIELPKKK